MLTEETETHGRVINIRGWAVRVMSQSLLSPAPVQSVYIHTAPLKIVLYRSWRKTLLLLRFKIYIYNKYLDVLGEGSITEIINI